MNLLNIYNDNKTIYLFCRNQEGKQTISPIDSFFHYFYETDTNGDCRSFNGQKVKKIACRSPRDIRNLKTDNSWESDVSFIKRFIIDRVPTIEKTIIKYFFIDIEVLAEQMPDYTKPNDTISCISVYNSSSKAIQTYFISDYTGTLEEQEQQLLSDFVVYVKKESPDLLIGWNFDFDYCYLFARYNKITGKSFAEAISPINKSRYSRKDLEDIYYPAGISIIDFLGWYKKITLNRKKSYALEEVAIEELKKAPRPKIKFDVLSDEIKQKNIEDVQYLVELEEQKKLISYYDEIRRIGKCLFEDLLFNSKVLDQMILSEAKQMNIVLPSKKYVENYEQDDEIKFEGAYRKAETGLFKNVFKVDLSSAYPEALINFCLDPANIRTEENINTLTIPITDRESNEIKTSVIFEQNSNAILPIVAKKLLNKKSELKKQLKEMSPNSLEYNDLQICYDAYKGLVNSVFGVTALKSFRLFDIRVASAITSLIRDLLHYIEQQLKEINATVVYLDTDSCFYLSEDNLIDDLNYLVQQWASEKYNKESINIEFTEEGVWTKLLILALCHYKGELLTVKKELKSETKGIESKKKDSSAYIKEFQPTLIDKVLNEEPKEQIIAWVKAEIDRFNTLPIEEIAFPARLATKIEDYSTTMSRHSVDESGKPVTKTFAKSLPIHVRAMKNSEKFGLQKRIGDTYLWCYVISDNPQDNVMAFDIDNKDFIKNVNYRKMMERNIIMKTEVIFEAMKWIVEDSVPKKEKKNKKSKEKLETLV